MCFGQQNLGTTVLLHQDFALQYIKRVFIFRLLKVVAALHRYIPEKKTHCPTLLWFRSSSFVWASPRYRDRRWAAILLSHRPEPSGRLVRGGSMDWTVEDNMVDGLYFCATLTGRSGGHTPFVQAGSETSDTGSEAVKPDPGSSWEGQSGCVCTGIWN